MAKYDPIVMKLELNVYIVGATELGIESARTTQRNLPKPPRGDRTPAMSPPTLLPLSKPSLHAGTPGAQAAKIAPMKCAVICAT